MLCSVQFSGQSLEAIACCVVKSVERISNSACIWHAFSLAAQSPVHSHCRLLSRHFDPLLLHTIVHLWTCRSYKTRRSYITTHRGMQAVPLFCKISVSTWTRLHVLKLLLLSCDWLTSMPPASALKPNLWRRGPKASHASAPPTVAVSHSSLATVRFLQRILLHLWASLQRYIQQTRQGRSIQAGNTIADMNTQNTLESSRIPSNEFNYRTNQMVQSLSPSATTNLMHQLVGI